MLPILVPASAKCIAAKILVIAKAVFFYDMIIPSKHLPIQS